MATCIFLGFFVYRRNPVNQANKLFLGLMVCFIFWQLLELKVIITSGPQQLFWIRALLAPILFLAPFFYHFTLVFPREDERLASKKQLVRLLYAPAVIISLLLVTVPLGIAPSFPPVEAFSTFEQSIQVYQWGFTIGSHPAFRAIRIYYVIYLILIFFNMRACLKRSREKQEKLQLNYIITSLLLPLALGSVVLLTFKYLLVGQGEENLSYYLIGLFPAIIILMSLVLAYSIVRYKLMGIRVIINKTLLYTLVTGSLATVYVAVEELMETLFQRLLPQEMSFFGIVAALVVAMVSVPLYRNVAKIIDRLFERKMLSHQDLLKRGVNKLRTITDRSLLQEVILEITAGWMKISHADLYVKEDGDFFRRCASRGAHPRRSDTLNVPGSCVILLNTGEPLVLSGMQPSRTAPEREEARRLCTSNGYEVLCPLAVGGNLYGLVGFGSKQSGEAFKLDDIHIFSVLCHQANLTLENILLKDRISSIEKFEMEFETARKLHGQFIPAAAPHPENYSICFTCQPSPDIRGNFLDFTPLAAGKTVIILGDVPGSGVEAATRVALLNGLIKGITAKGMDPADTVEAVNQALSELPGEQNVIPLFFGVLDCINHLLKYCHVHDTQPYQLSGGNKTPLKRCGEFCGLSADSRYTSETARLAPGDRIAIFSKGAADAVDVDRLTMQPDLTGDDLAEMVRQTVGSPPSLPDDKTVIILGRIR